MGSLFLARWEFTGLQCLFWEVEILAMTGPLKINEAKSMMITSLGMMSGAISCSLMA